ncbi:indolepyruvate oxidoreductase subunit beta family protein [Sphingomonas sp. HITSZ_GF]|uniref:indolepyruvate oxidoreductase subunit beta family protein n=1 Tax=Sphingomonas sp. HITSZ_GF TaxID=3037247 RepID=UPI00240DE1DE|nr:indolepyruvate oxidoreductase subunit beta family protein [Sphingomonas sp. HITSZ_GF]MDG2534203.1 indolepyruvate oxidoreductase subunit beta family protein [Sphingomonas sp. HITSZ_GF]
MAERKRIAIAVLGLGGQGGGVLADWIVQLGERNGYVAQGTSVPGVAQRTGATIYYIEMIPAGADAPVLSLTPIPGDVDVVVASELMETGRAILRGFVSKDTVLIGSTHRVYAISEKSAMGDGRASSERIVAAANERAKRFIGFDMEAASERAGTVISSVLFGALAGSGALPFPREAFEAAIRAGGKGVEASLKGFASGFDAAQGKLAEAEAATGSPEPTTEAGRTFAARLRERLPAEAHGFATEGVKRLMDYQDAGYAALYLDRLESLDGTPELIAEAARHLALWMSYEDTIRVADLKVRASRFARVRGEVKASDDQIVQLTEYMHPRLEEICETLPAGIGRRILASKTWSRQLAPLFTKGRHVETTSLRWFLMLSLLAGWRRRRRGTLRYQIEQARIEDWLALVRAAAPDAAIELVRCQRLIKGYGETFERGLGNYQRIVARWQAGGLDAAGLRRLREAALADEEGVALTEALAS